jgi:hypothetical protein
VSETYVSAGYHAIKAPGNYTTTYDAPSYYTDALNYRYPSVAASSKCFFYSLSVPDLKLFVVLVGIG